MLVTVLTKNGGFLGPIAVLLGWIMNAIYEFFNLFGIQNIALSIFVFTFIARALMLPLTIKQQKFTKLSSKMNPELQKIQAKYKGKKDEVSLRKQQEETQAVYQKYGANPASGCLPLIIQLPVMFALYYVIYDIPAYVNRVKLMYTPVATQISQAVANQGVLRNLAKGVRGLRDTTDLSNSDQVINILAQLKPNKWIELSNSIPAMKDTILTSWDKISHVNNFFGLNIAGTPKVLSWAIIIPILAAALQYISGKQLQTTNKDANKDNPAASAMNSMNVVMPIMSLFFCIGFPIGIGLYWIAGSLFAIIQQYFVNRYMNRIDVDALIEKNLAKASKRKPRQIETNGMTLRDVAKRQTKSINTVANTVSEKENTEVKDTDDQQDVSEEKENKNVSKNSAGQKSISEIANLLKNRN